MCVNNRALHPGLTALAGLLLPLVALATPVSPSEYLFLQGYQSYLEKNYSLCADQLFSTLAFEDKFGNQARLYLAACQEKLELRNLAAYHLGLVHSPGLSRSDQDLFKKLKEAVKEEYSNLYDFKATLFPYYGRGTFSAGGSKQSSQFYGAYGNFRYQDWNGFVAGESIHFAMNNGLPSYAQTQVTLGAGVWAAKSLQVHLNGAFQSATVAEYSQGRMLGGGVNYQITALTTLGLDYFYSSFPNLTFGSSGVHQANVSVGQYLFSRPQFSLRTQLLVQTVLPAAQPGTDSTTGFVLKSNYQRYALDVEFSTQLLQGDLMGWLGTEAFGVRNEGLILFNTLEEHRGGWSASLGFRVLESLTVRGLVSQEFFVVGGPQIIGTSYGGGLHVFF